jgi:hypothetical protein
MKRALAAIALLLSVSPLAAAPRRRVAAAPAGLPPCVAVDGTPGVTFSRDGGATLAPVTQKLEGIAYSYGLAAMTTELLLATHKQTLSTSEDAGCTWRAVATLEGEQFYRIVPAPSGLAYIWDDNREYLARYDARITTLTKLRAPAASIGLGVDPGDGRHILLGATDGAIWESRDAGDSWSKISSLPAQQLPINYRFAFDPSNVNHVVVGAAGSAYYTTNAGRTWFQSDTMRGVNVFNVVIAPSDGNTVWAMGLNLAESDANVPSHGDHIYLSRDGGATFFPVVDGSADVHLINQPVMAAHPTDANVVYFIFGTYFQGYGTDIYRYDDATKSVTTFHNDYDDINAIAFSPRDPRVMYFGLETEKRTAP